MIRKIEYTDYYNYTKKYTMLNQRTISGPRDRKQGMRSMLPRLSLLRRLIAGRYCGDSRTWKSLSKGLHWIKASSPRWLRHSALRMLGKEAITSLVGGTWRKGVKLLFCCHSSRSVFCLFSSLYYCFENCFKIGQERKTMDGKICL